PSCSRIDLGRVQAVLGCKHLHFASEEQMGGWFKGCPAGAVPPLRLRSDEIILLDRSLAHLGTMVFAAGSHEDAVAVRFRDWYRAVRPGVGHFILPIHAADGRAVLIVEDEIATNALLCRLLEREGYSCHGAHEGSQALD